MVKRVKTVILKKTDLLSKCIQKRILNITAK